MSPPLLLALGPRTLYIGPAFGLSAHACTVSVLACGLDGSFQASAGPALAAGQYTECRCAFVPAHTLHHLVCGHTTMAFLYTDPLGLDEARLRARAEIGQAPIAHRLSDDAALIDRLVRLQGAAAEQRSALWRELLDHLDIHHAKGGDERILASVARLAQAPAARHSLAELAAAANLSTSRFLHLFKATTGVPLRRYRLWIRVGGAVRGVARGRSMTDAALDAGFASSSHFSFVFREMFGMTPSTLGGLGVQYARDAAASPRPAARQAPSG